MMNRRLYACLFGLFLLVASALVLRAQTPSVATSVSTQPATQVSATQPAHINITTKVEMPAAATQPAAPTPPPTAMDAFNQSILGQVFTGQRALTIDDVKNPIFWFDTAKDLVIAVLTFIPRLLGTLVFLFIFWLIYRGIRKMIVGSMKKQEVDSSIRDLLGGLIKWCIMGFGIVIACNQLGIPIVAMLTGVSIIGLAVGFAAQETLSNFIAGIVIFLDKPFKVGDWIQVGEEQGAVRRITFRSTRFTNLDNDVVVIPNSKILSDQIINKSSNDITRVNIPIGIAYKESIDRAREALLAAVAKDPRIVHDPEPEVVVRACAASSVDLMLHFWIKEERYQDAMVWEYIEVAKKALDAAGIEIPFPHMQVLLEDTPAVERLSGIAAKRDNGASN